MYVCLYVCEGTGGACGRRDEKSLTREMWVQNKHYNLAIAGYLLFTLSEHYDYNVLGSH